VGGPGAERVQFPRQKSGQISVEIVLGEAKRFLIGKLRKCDVASVSNQIDGLVIERKIGFVGFDQPAVVRKHGQCVPLFADIGNELMDVGES
jgi:hypothetical protein